MANFLKKISETILYLILQVMIVILIVSFVGNGLIGEYENNKETILSDFYNLTGQMIENISLEEMAKMSGNSDIEAMINLDCDTYTSDLESQYSNSGVDLTDEAILSQIKSNANEEQLEYINAYENCKENSSFNVAGVFEEEIKTQLTSSIRSNQETFKKEVSSKIDSYVTSINSNPYLSLLREQILVYFVFVSLVVSIILVSGFKKASLSLSVNLMLTGGLIFLASFFMNSFLNLSFIDDATEFDISSSMYELFSNSNLFALVMGLINEIALYILLVGIGFLIAHIINRIYFPKKEKEEIKSDQA